MMKKSATTFLKVSISTLLHKGLSFATKEESINNF